MEGRPAGRAGWTRLVAFLALTVLCPATVGDWRLKSSYEATASERLSQLKDMVCVVPDGLRHVFGPPI
jgi:hypothetical protein